MTEQDEIIDVDLMAAADYYDALLSGNLPQCQASNYANDRFGLELEDRLLNRALELYATSASVTIEKCVKAVLVNAGYQPLPSSCL